MKSKEATPQHVHRLLKTRSLTASLNQDLDTMVCGAIFGKKLAYVLDQVKCTELGGPRQKSLIFLAPSLSPSFRDSVPVAAEPTTGVESHLLPRNKVAKAAALTDKRPAVMVALAPKH